MLTLIPRVSEKAYAAHQDGTYVFNVPMSANKAGVIAALKEQYDVTAKDVRFVIQNGKPVRASRGKRAQPGEALRTKKKKAYVSLVEGASLNLFNEGEEK
ncbi:TPA: 50S ribosomal protein L23 [Candidatus Saccharibacteria bacterium]|nr:50S ribosomal protein L23 [Candidatus Saccharibacteria bacterium]HRK40936.1 50S ribosomal protein L23 [Candidatus Saccharibacteria bacterium]